MAGGRCRPPPALDGGRHLAPVLTGWEPSAKEIYDAVETYFNGHDPEQPPHFIPGKPTRRLGHPVDMRVVLIVVRSKPFRVFFRYRQQVF